MPGRASMEGIAGGTTRCGLCTHRLNREASIRPEQVGFAGAEARTTMVRDGSSLLAVLIGLDGSKLRA